MVPNSVKNHRKTTVLCYKGYNDYLEMGEVGKFPQLVSWLVSSWQLLVQLLRLVWRQEMMR